MPDTLVLRNSILTAAFNRACDLGLSPIRLARRMLDLHEWAVREVARREYVRKRTEENEHLAVDVCQRCGDFYNAQYGRHVCVN